MPTTSSTRTPTTIAMTAVVVDTLLDETPEKKANNKVVTVMVMAGNLPLASFNKKVKKFTFSKF